MGLAHRDDVPEEILAEFEKEAVSHGAAEYVIADPESGRVEFRWKDEQ